jgi:hypothetical protein
MDEHKIQIDTMVNKLKVLDSRIQKLESLADGVLNEVESIYRQQIKELHLKKETIQQKISDIQETGHNI